MNISQQQSRQSIRDQLVKTYGMVDNPTWFARRLAEHERKGDRQMQKVIVDIAERHNITIACGSQVSR